MRVSSEEAQVDGEILLIRLDVFLSEGARCHLRIDEPLLLRPALNIAVRTLLFLLLGAGLFIGLGGEILCLQQVHVEQRGVLYALIGRNSFPAAGTVALELEQRTKTIFAGTPGGLTGNQPGDAPDLLPNSKFTVDVYDYSL